LLDDDFGKSIIIGSIHCNKLLGNSDNFSEVIIEDDIFLSKFLGVFDFGKYLESLIKFITMFDRNKKLKCCKSVGECF